MSIDTMLDIKYGTLTPLVGIQKWLLGYKKGFPSVWSISMAWSNSGKPTL